MNPTTTRRDEMDPTTRAVSDTLDEYLSRHHGILASHTNAEDFMRWLGENGYRVVPGVFAAPPAEDTRPDITEQAARTLYLHDREGVTRPGFGERMWDEGHADGGVRQKYTAYAQALDAAGLLARPLASTPTREQIARAIGDELDDVSLTGKALDRAAGAVLALLEGGGDR